MTVMSFFLGEEEYCIETSSIVEVISESEFTPIPQSESYMAGLINLRGIIVPVVDMRIRFGLSTYNSERESIIVVAIRLDFELIHVGLLVDSVYDVLELEESGIKKLTGLIDINMREFFKGVLDWNGKSIIILNLEKTIKDTEFIKKIKHT